MSRTNGFGSSGSTGQMCPSYYVAASRTWGVTRPRWTICPRRGGRRSVQTRPWPFAVRSKPSTMWRRQPNTRTGAAVIMARLSNCALWRPSSIKTKVRIAAIFKHGEAPVCIRPYRFLSLCSLCWRTIIFWRNSWGIVTDSMRVIWRLRLWLALRLFPNVMLDYRLFPRNLWRGYRHLSLKTRPINPTPTDPSPVSKHSCRYVRLSNHDETSDDELM